MNPVVKDAELQLIYDLRRAWDAAHDVEQTLQVMDRNSGLSSRQMADLLMAAFSLSPITIGIVREWRDGRLATSDFYESLGEMIVDARLESGS